MSALPPDFAQTANERYNVAKRFFHNWKAEARDSYRFIAGDQWLEVDETILREQKRPPITFNYSEKMIDAVVGAEVSNRQEVIYRPREVTDAAVSELWNNAAAHVRDTANTEDEETDAFRDALICGMGWTFTHMTYDEDLDGRIQVDRKDPLLMLCDPAATKPGVADRRYNFCIDWVDKKDARREWPDQYTFAEEAADANAGVVSIGHSYEDDDTDRKEQHQDQVQIRHYECYEREVVYRVAGQNGMLELTSAEFKQAKSTLDENGTQYVKQFRKVYYYAYFAGETLLEGGKSPCQKGFSYNCITAKRDRNKNTWYGLTRVMIDPQRWANKWLSQILHIINSNAKGGLLAETGAFVDIVKAQEEWSMPESITLLNEGGIEKVREKTMTNFPSGLDRLMNFALSSLPMVTGINLEALGLANREQAGVLEQERKQAAYGLLSPLFDSLRRYRKIQGRVLLEFMHKFISDGRMVRIGGQQSQQFLPLTHQPGAMEYDIFVDQSPNAPDVKEKTWQTLTNLVPAMLKAGMPLPPNLLDYAPVPVALAMEWKKVLEQAQQNKGLPPEVQKQMQAMQEENQKLKQSLADKSEELKLKQAEMIAEFKLKQEQLNRELQIDIAKAKAEMQLAKQKQSDDRQLKQEEIHNDISARMTEVVQSGANEASKNIQDTISKLMIAIDKASKE